MEANTFLITPGKQVKIAELPTNAHEKKPDKKDLLHSLRDDIDEIADYQNKLFAESRQSLLIILQGMDASGKDSAVKHIMSGLNPQGVIVHSFKQPTSSELSHDYLWRHYLKLPEKGQIAIFNRSHYENVLIAKVHPEIVLTERLPGIEKVEDVDAEFWFRRYQQINIFEDTISRSGIHILKFFLHVSSEEQRKRFLKRIEEKEKHWKFNYADIVERDFWDKYQKAYEDALNSTSTDYAPWYAIPADSKWYAHMLMGKIILDKLKQMNPQFPTIDKEEEEKLQQAKEKLENENIEQGTRNKE